MTTPADVLRPHPDTPTLNTLLDELGPDAVQQVTTGWPAPPLDADNTGTAQPTPDEQSLAPKRTKTTKRSRTRKRSGST
ncbi:MAG: hypothetical protein GEU83_12085 [Pseudonocardiaceae bacterium]|nr:hypothetical protein [Pseudonocardiaceae bacterium]